MIHWGWLVFTAFIMFYAGMFIMALLSIIKNTVNEDETVCRVCGCTDEQACEGGCYWVEPGLCSRCAEKAEEVQANHETSISED